LVTWGRAWSAAFAWLAWTFIYGILGIIVIVAGVFVIGSYLNNLTSLNNLVSASFYTSKLFSGFILIVIGWIIIALGAVASFFKINSEIITEEVQSYE